MCLWSTQRHPWLRLFPNVRPTLSSLIDQLLSRLARLPAHHSGNEPFQEGEKANVCQDWIAPSCCDAIIGHERRMMMPAVVFGAEDEPAALQPSDHSRRRFPVRPLVELAGPRAPRPHRPDEDRTYQPEFIAKRYVFRTGFARVLTLGPDGRFAARWGVGSRVGQADRGLERQSSATGSRERRGS